MPSVRKNESKEKYLSRCIPTVLKEGGSRDHAIAKCIGMYEQSKKKKQAKGDTSEPDFDKENDLKVAIFLPN